MIRLAAVCATVVAAVSGYPRPQGPEGPLPIPREGSYGPDQYFQYINVPAHKTFEWGYKRGNPKHNREEYLSQKDHTFKAKLKWNDGYAGHGEHYFDYNHGNNERIVEAPNSFAKREAGQDRTPQEDQVSRYLVIDLQA